MLEQLLERAQADENAVGIIVHGSRGRGATRGRDDRRPATAAAPLDGYVNSLHRSLKNAQESVRWWLDFVFAVHGRIRPYNKWLEWELAHHPLPPSCNLQLGRLERIARTPDGGEQRALFRETEALAREHGLDATIDGWEPEVAWLRG